MWPYNLQQTYELVRHIAAEVFGHVPHGEPVFLARGSTNAAFEIDIDDGRRFVIRVTGEWRERTTRQERWCYGHAQRLGIPSPEVVAIGKLEKLPYIVLTYVEGTGGVESAIDRRQLWSTLGRYGRLINSVETGELSMIEDDRPLYPEPRTQWFQWLDAAERNFLVEGGTFSEHERDTIRTLLKELRGRPFQFGLSRERSWRDSPHRLLLLTRKLGSSCRPLQYSTRAKVGFRGDIRLSSRLWLDAKCVCEDTARGARFRARTTA